MGGGSTKKTTTSNSLTEFANQSRGWDPAMDLAERNLSGVGNLLGQPMGYTGPSYLAPNAAMLQGINQQYDYAGGQGAATNAAGFNAWNDALNPYQFLQAEGAYAPLGLYGDQVQRQMGKTRGGYADQAIAGGQTGGLSARRVLQDADLMDTAERNIADFGSRLTGNLVSQGIGARNQAIGQLPMIYGQGKLPYQDIFKLGDYQRGEEYKAQQMGNAADQFAFMEPWQRAQLTAGLVNPTVGFAQNQSGSQETNATATQKAKKSMGIGDILGAAAAGASMFAGNPAGLTGMGGGAGGFGGLGSLFSGGSGIGSLFGGGSPGGSGPPPGMMGYDLGGPARPAIGNYGMYPTPGMWGGSRY